MLVRRRRMSPSHIPSAPEICRQLNGDALVVSLVYPYIIIPCFFHVPSSSKTCVTNPVCPSNSTSNIPRYQCPSCYQLSRVCGLSCIGKSMVVRRASYGPRHLRHLTSLVFFRVADATNNPTIKASR